jgi:hypothetical protein
MNWYQTLLVIAGAVGAAGVIWKSPVGKVIRWLARKNIVEPLKAASRSLIRETVAPLVDDVKAAARSQHDEQNSKLEDISDRLTDHSRRLSLIEDHITRPKGDS